MPYIPDSVFEGGTWETLTAVEAKVYVTLCRHYNRKERMAFPSMLRIARICGCSKRHVVRVIKLLAQKGLIVKRKKDNPYGRSFNYYRLPDFLLYELQQLQKNPVKNAGDIMSLAGDIVSLVGDIRGRRQETLSHQNYIINHITNIVNSFNSKEETKNTSDEHVSITEEDKEGIRAYARAFGADNAGNLLERNGCDLKSIRQIFEGIEAQKYCLKR